jgi:hypothetical protein
MPAELENTSITFTDEAETALHKRLLRLERELRGRAIDEAVRTRGLPAEVTGSDIQRAFNRIMSRRYLPGRDVERTSFAFHPGAQITRGFGISEIEGHQRERNIRRSLSERVANFYAWLGFVIGLIGLLWAPVYHRVKNLSIADPIWRFGFLVAGAGLAMSFVGIAAGLFFSKIRRDRDRQKLEQR